MGNYKVETVSLKREYKAQFIKLFVLCLALMFLEKIIQLFNDAPSLFGYGDFIYHIFVGIFSILAQLSTSVAAAIVFYYCLEFINKKKDFKKYLDYRRNLLFIIYQHMEILSKCNGFEQLKLGNRNKRFFDADDMELYISLLEKQKNEIENFIKQIKNILNSSKQFGSDIRFYGNKIKDLKENGTYGYIKNNNEILEELYDLFETLEIHYDNLEEVKNSAYMDAELDDTSKLYIDFINFTTYYCVDINKFIRAINNYNIWTFMKYLD